MKKKKIQLESGFCSKSKKWIAFMETAPKSCPHDLTKCYECDHFKKKKLTAHAKSIFKIMDVIL